MLQNKIFIKKHKGFLWKFILKLKKKTVSLNFLFLYVNTKKEINNQKFPLSSKNNKDFIKV